MTEGEKKPKRRGRMGKYDSHVKPYLKRIPKWRRQGMTEKQICQKLSIGVSTWEEYKNKHPELTEALKEGKEELIEQLETSLFQKAMGFEYEETETYIEMKADGSKTPRVRKHKKRALPDTGALAFSLKNLAPEQWRDRRETEISGKLDIADRSDIFEKYLKDVDA